MSSEWLIEVAGESVEHDPLTEVKNKQFPFIGSPKKYRRLYESIGSHYVATHSRTRRFNAMHHEMGASAFVLIFHEDI